jgi:hypothetical protein
VAFVDISCRNVLRHSIYPFIIANHGDWKPSAYFRSVLPKVPNLPILPLCTFLPRFGGRARMSTTLTHAGLPVGVTRFDLLRLFEQVARPALACPPPPWRWCGIMSSRRWMPITSRAASAPSGRRPAALPRRLGITPRSINSAERELERAGFIIRNAGINGARAGDRQDGIITWAAGINLAP